MSLIGALSSGIHAFGTSPFQGAPPSSITLTAIDAFAIDADSGGTVASATGGTMPGFSKVVDPTPYVSGATGAKTDWSVQFQGTSLGTWSRLGSGDLSYAPGAAAGTESAQYRVSDDAGVSWSDWQDITIEVVARPAGSFYLVEDYAGVDGVKVQAAIDAADAAPNGVVSTITRRGDVLTITGVTRADGTWGLLWRSCHLLGLSLKQPNAKDNNGTGAECSPTGNGVTSGWKPGFFDDLIRGGLLNGTNWGTTTRYEAVLCTFDGNAAKMALHETSGDNAIPNSNDGTCYPGNRLANGNDVFNLQQQSAVRLKGGTGGTVGERRLGRFKRSIIKSTCGDGLNNAGGMDVELDDCIHEDCFRGSPNMIGSNSNMVIVRNVTRVGSDNINGRVDHETETVGSLDSDLVLTDCSTEGLFDMTARSATGTTAAPGSTYVIEGCTVGPQLNLLSRVANGVTVTFRGTALNPRGTIRYHVQGGGKYSTHPASRLGGWAGATPHNCLWLFEDQDFVAYGDPYIFNTETFTPGAEAFAIRFGETVNIGDDWNVTIINCTVAWFNKPVGATGKLFTSAKTLTTAHTLRLDGLTIGTGFDQAAVQLDGHRLEYRNVSHADFPSATIQDICPGAGSYVAI